ncbi:MAG: P-loop NTPase fold protein [Scytonema sp. PMC 1069.18]|nr:P-loop NTPase fold protein [Scytonema sp. PMC 1069.18]MEC4882252.1 P-loop NTPase fold protein [Scytonema sp. PMC 1070.18]
MSQTVINEYPLENPLKNPEKDRLGYASFAKYLAESICKMEFADGFAIAVYGSWSTGKSTLLNFVIHYLQQQPEEERPIIVPFNPWLFSGYQDVTKRFFDQLQNVLSKTTSVSKGIRETIAEFANIVGAIPVPYAQASKAVATLFDYRDREAAEIKEEVEDTLSQQQQRIIITIDDVDRLAPEDIRQLFRILKAIPNFTNVVYLLVFNQEVVSKALTEAHDLPGQGYLEKIIQVAFELPHPDKTSLRRLLFEKLGSVFVNTPQHLFNRNRWSDVYFQGVDHFITNLPNIVSLTNTLTVTYPAVKGQVNVVDFIAIESLRVFFPTVYEIIRKNQNAFLGQITSSLDEIKEFHNFWIARLQNQDKQPIKHLLMYLFPYLEVIWGNRSNYEIQELEWREQARVCCPEVFSIYFCLNLLEADLPYIQIKDMLASAYDSKAFGRKLVELAHKQRPDRTSQARAFLERMEEDIEKDISINCIPTIIEALLDIGEQLICPEDEPTTMFDFGNDMRITRLISKLLSRLNQPTRFEVLKTSMSQGQSIVIIMKQLESLAQQQASHPQEEWLLSKENLQELEVLVDKRQWIQKFNDK